MTALVDELFFIGTEWTQVDDAVMQPFNFVDAQFDLFLIACCQVNKQLDFSGTDKLWFCNWRELNGTLPVR